VELKFVKMHGAGNDFILVDGAEEAFAEEQLAPVARGACAGISA
jgi:diaminopimelate epimerase